VAIIRHPKVELGVAELIAERRVGKERCYFLLSAIPPYTGQCSHIGHVGHVGHVCCLCTALMLCDVLYSHTLGVCVTYKTCFGFDDRIYWTFIQLDTTFRKSLSSTGHSRLLTALQLQLNCQFCWRLVI
jgi:hypothetical protein